MSRSSLFVVLSLLGASGAIALALVITQRAELAAPTSHDEPADRFLSLDLQTQPDAVEPGPSRQEEGKVGKKDAEKNQGDGDVAGRDSAEDAGVLGALRAPKEVDRVMSDGLSDDLSGGIGGLIGAKGTQIGTGGLGSRGVGMGGGGRAEGLGGLGTVGRAGGAVGYGSSAGASASSNGVSVGASPSIDVLAQPRWSVDGTEDFTDYGVNQMTLAKHDNLSTFGIDVDTGSYTLARSSLNSGSLPSASSVRVEEFVNYFDYDYVGPTGDAPFAVNMEAAPNPWVHNHHVLRIGVQGDRVDASERKPVRLVFLVDVSGSMSGGGRLDLAKQSISYLVDQLGPEDSVGLVTYAGAVKRVLEPTSVTDKGRIKRAIGDLRSGGSTAMGSGIDWAYEMAEAGFVEGAENRVIVLSDGDANVGKTSHEQMLQTIRGYAKKGITLSTVGFGRGNYKDTMMEQLADEGDGNYSYVDSLDEGQRLFGERLSGTVQTIARDVKIQVEFNPKAVIGYRLIGYENRDIADADFRDDQVDAGEIGSGHSVTALYDVVLKDGWASKELATVRLRAKPPGADVAAEEWLTTFQPRLLRRELTDASDGFRLALGAATFAELMRGSPYAEEITYGQVWEMVEGARRPGQDEDDELLGLIEKAGKLTGETGFLASR